MGALDLQHQYQYVTELNKPEGLAPLQTMYQHAVLDNTKVPAAI